MCPVDEVLAVLRRIGRGTLLDGIALIDSLVAATRAADPQSAASSLRAAAADTGDDLLAIAAVHALAAIRDPDVVAASVVPILRDGPPQLAEHAAWALGGAAPVSAAVGPLIAMVAGGGFTGALAQRTVESWTAAAGPITVDLLNALAATGDPGRRTRLLETIGVLGTATADLVAVARDAGEADEVRAAAFAALGDAPRDAEAVAALLAASTAGDDLAAVARLAHHDLSSRHRDATTVPVAPGLAVAQVFLHADIDGSLHHAGQGDTGGIATLLVHLGDALLHHARISRVLTVSRGEAAQGEPPSPTLGHPGHHYTGVPLWGPRRHAADAWGLRVAARRGLRRILRAARPDVLHLRMADVGSWAAVEVATELGIPIVLTLAPDPHALIAARERQGDLSRSTFGAADLAGHLVFRVRLLHRLAGQAAHLVLLPRPDLEQEVGDLLALELDTHPVAWTVVPEGIDLAPIDAALVSARGAEDAGGEHPGLQALDAVLAELPPQRRGLPVAISVGRLHPVKGMATLVQAWAGDPALQQRCNLLVVGGDLDDPNDDEADQLARIDRVIPRSEGPGRGLLLAGHRPNAMVAAWLAGVRFGRPGRCAPGGGYVSASLKEEFGIAILEAMATGLVVVAPDGGGPATYVEDGVTGVLTDTSRAPTLASALSRALDLAMAADADERAAEAMSLVRRRFGIDRMATALAPVYAGAARAGMNEPPSERGRR